MDVKFQVGNRRSIWAPEKPPLFELATGFRTSGSSGVHFDCPVFHQGTCLENDSRVLLGIVPQRPHLVTGSLAENVSLCSS